MCLNEENIDNPEVHKGVLSQIERAFQQRQGVFDEGFLAFGALCTFFGKAMEEFIP